MWYNNNIFNALTVFAKGKEDKYGDYMVENEDNAIQYVYASAVPQKYHQTFLKKLFRAVKKTVYLNFM